LFYGYSKVEKLIEPESPEVKARLLKFPKLISPELEILRIEACELFVRLFRQSPSVGEWEN
jgi:hypothetical protein